MLCFKISDSLTVWSALFNFIILIIFCCLKVSESAIILSSSGAYSGISVALSHQLQEESCGSTVKAIQNVFSEASKALQTATSATFEEVTIVIPESWNNCDPFYINSTDGLLSWNNADYRVGTKHPIFGEEIWTKQPRGCGMAGDFTYIPYAWLYRTDIRKDRRMLQEWAKYRWGVFEEYGHYLDNVYPESFRDVAGRMKPNYCTNEPLSGNFEKSCVEAIDCKFKIDGAGNGNIRSSVMAVPDVKGVTEFCNEATHLQNIPTKQNVICNGKSNKMVTEEHADATVLKQIRATSKISTNPLKVSVVRESQTPSVVIAFETSEAMKKEANQFEFMKESISQFIVYEAPSTAKIGIVSFSDYATVRSGMMKLDVKSRVYLAHDVLKTTTSRGNANLKMAIETAAKTIGVGNGAILLVTKSTDENPNFTVAELVEAANGHSVWIILYPFISDKYLKTYSELVSTTGGQLQIVERELSVDVHDNSLMSTGVRMKLSQSFRQILHLDPIVDIQQVSSTVCSEKVCRLDMDISSSIDPSSELYLYYSITNIVSSVSVIEGGSCTMEDYGKMKDLIHSTSTLKCTLRENASKLSLMVERQLFYGDLIAELVGHPKYNNTSYDFKIYASNNIYDLKYTETMAPVILIEVTYEERLILFANVSIEIPFKDSSQVIYMRDDGTGADITGNDGIYSAYLVPALPPGGFHFNVSAHHNNYKARLSPEVPVAGTVTPCCGSSIHLPNNLDVAPSFNFSRKLISSRITTGLPNLNLPPGQIKDFILTGIKTGTPWTVSLAFTAPGADLDYGIASSYILTRSMETSFSKESTLNVIPAAAGLRELIQIEIEECDKSYIYSLVALDERKVRGSPSNMVSVYVPCKAAKGKASAGTVIGIVFGCFILVALIIAFVYWLRRRKGKKSKKRSQPQVKGPKVVREESGYPSSIPTALVRPPPVQVEQIRTIHDLGLQPTISTHQRASEEPKTPSLKQENLSKPFLNSSADSNSGSHHFDIIVAGDNYLPDSANMNYDNRNIQIAKNYYQKGSYSKDSFSKQTDFERYGSQSTLHSSNSTGLSYSESPINQVGIPMNPNPYAHRVNKSLENLLRGAPPVPPKRVRYYEV